MLVAGFALIAAAPSNDPPTPPPSPPPLNASSPSPSPSPSDVTLPQATPSASPVPSPSASASPDLNSVFGGHGHGRGGHRPQASGTPSPPPQQTRTGLDGVWELEIQRGPKTEYEHMNLVQTGQSITGFYLTKDKKKYPLSGSVDGQNNFRVVISMPDGSTVLLEARVDGNTDMLGMLTDAKEQVPFTGEFRAKEKWIENVNAAPGGIMPGAGGSGPP